MTKADVESISDEDLMALFREADVDASDLDLILGEIERRNLDI